MSKRIDPKALPPQIGTDYPHPYDEPCRVRERRRLGDAAGLTQFGVNLLRLPPGAWSAQRHWHETEDEFIQVLAGAVVLVTDDGEETLRAGDCAGFPAGEQNGHHLQNRSDTDALVLEVGTRSRDETAHYPGLDLVAERRAGAARFTHLDGTPYDKGGDEKVD